MAEPDFWSDQERAKSVSQQAADIRSELDSWSQLESDVTEAIELIPIAEAENDKAVLGDLQNQSKELQKRFTELELKTLFTGEYDKKHAIVAIHAGSGGTEANDWTGMLFRMYLRYAEKMGFEVKILNESRAEEVGYKSVLLEIRGRWAYGYLQSEHGVHRLVRISPFDAEKMRHTTFALVEVLPKLDDMKEIEINEKDLRIDTFLSSGHGGQSVNTTYSAVRITHVPTNITVTCQNERSQQQNKESAMGVLRTKLHALELEKRAKEKQELRGAYTSAEWGNQIRSYVLHPYQMVKDHRTNFETQDTQGILDGDLTECIEAYLRHKMNT